MGKGEGIQMHFQSRHLFLYTLIFAWLISLFIGHSSIANSDTISIDDHHQLLEKGLTIYEIDQELLRIADREAQVALEIKEATIKLQEEEEIVQDKRERAGKIIRAYYSGERSNLLRVILFIDNFSDAWTVIEYLQVIFANDQYILQTYLDSYRELKQSIAALKEIEVQLQEIKQLYLDQRNRLVQLQEELDAQLAELPDKEEVLSEIEQLTLRWEQHGLPLFQQYFSSLSEAMQQLPEILSEYEGMLTAKGLQWTFTMTDEQLNSFLRNKNEQFHQLTFKFEEDRIIAVGEADDTTIQIGGQYVVLDEPVNHIGFILDELQYDGYYLPDTTQQQFTEQFDLGFYPQNIIPFVVASDVVVEEGKLIVQLRLSTD